MENLEIDNWGKNEGNTLKDKFFNEEVDLQVMAIVAKAKAMMKLKEMGIDPSVLEGGQDQGKGGSSKGGGSGCGRCAHLEKKSSTEIFRVLLRSQMSGDKLHSWCIRIEFAQSTWIFRMFQSQRRGIHNEAIG